MPLPDTQALREMSSSPKSGKGPTTPSSFSQLWNMAGALTFALAASLAHLGGLCQELELEGVTSPSPSALLRLWVLGALQRLSKQLKSPQESAPLTPQGGFGLYSLRKHTFPWVGRPGGIVFHLCTGSLR